MQLSRRTVLSGGIAATMVGRAPAQDRWAQVADVARGLDQLRSLSVAVNGQTVFAEAFRGPALARAVPIKSVSKSIVATLLGAAIDRKEIPSVSATLGQLTPNLIPNEADARVAEITLEDLVTLRAGLERTSGANYGGWVSSQNWVSNALSRPMVATPGTQMLYSTGSTHILGAVLAEVTGQTLLQQARQRIGRPLGIDVPAWTRDPQGRYLGGNEMSMVPADMLRFAEMIRLEGSIDGTQVISADWLRRSFVPRTRSRFSGLSYGYGWFLDQNAGLAIARGYGGQIIAVAPARGLSIAITSDPTRPARSRGYFSDLMRLMTQDILPAAA